MSDFTPWQVLAGGLILGLATVAYLWLNGRYAGISGMIRTVAYGGDPDRPLDTLFVIGLIVAGLLTTLAFGPRLAALPAPLWAFAAGGILVGFGTALGRGCTSGHGVCGLGRLSRRSFVAVVTFMGTGIVTTFVTRHVLGIH